MSLSRVLRGSIWLSLGSILANFLGFIYWLLISPMVSPATVGKAATILAIQNLLLSTLSLGIPTGVRRFLGREYSRQNPITMGEYFYSSLIFILGLDVAIGLLFLGLGLLGGIIPLDLESVLFTSILIVFGMNGWPLLLASLFHSTLETEYITVAQLVMSLSRLLIGVPLVYLGLNFYGIMLGYIIAAITNAFTLLLFTKRQLHRLGAKFSIAYHAIVDSLKAGLATWIPSILALAGQWLGVLGLSGLVGSYETGTYFIAYTITAGLLAFPRNILILMFPVLSGMEDGRKRAMSNAVRIASAIMYPLAFMLITYPAFIPSLLGEAYLPAATPIMILAAGFLLAPLVNGYTYYAYALGEYRQVTIIGLAGNLPRMILYLLLIRELAEVGAATSFSLGFLFSLLAVIPLAKQMNYRLNLKDTTKTLVIPLAFYILALILRLPPIVGIPLILTLPYLSYARLRILSKKDLRDLSTALLSKEALAALSPYL
ncbi:MAG: oligosaccharide flippase family protein, partial [Candidatus Njordarchaeales archaeon]